MNYHSYFESPVGQLLVLSDGEFVTGLYLPRHKGWDGLQASSQQNDSLFADIRAQLAEYFASKRQAFKVPLKLTGTPFQERVWQELQKIPYGATITYAELARRVGQPSASRAVGNANGRNPISILVPCHRVIGASGRLTGYAGGLDKKCWLLDWERGAAAKENGARKLEFAADTTL